MEELEIKIVLSYKVPENGLTLNGILRGLQEDQNTLMRNMVNALLVFEYWLEGKGWIPLTTNMIESAFSRIVNRVKHIGRRWSDEGLINWLMIVFRKIYKPALWNELWEKYLKIHKQLQFSRLRVSYAWIQYFPVTLGQSLILS